MWRAALPRRQHRLALAGLMIAASIAGTAVSADRSPAAAPADKLWAIALPTKFKMVSPATTQVAV